MGSKRRQSIKRQGSAMFSPDYTPCFTYNGKVLSGEYDRGCFLEGWYKAQGEYDSALKEAQESEVVYD